MVPNGCAACVSRYRCGRLSAIITPPEYSRTSRGIASTTARASSDPLIPGSSLDRTRSATGISSAVAMPPEMNAQITAAPDARLAGIMRSPTWYTIEPLMARLPTTAANPVSACSAANSPRSAGWKDAGEGDREPQGQHHDGELARRHPDRPAELSDGRRASQRHAGGSFGKGR